MKPAIERLDAGALAPHAPGLRALEAAIGYPVGTSDTFHIDHGPTYHPFFSGMGEAHFLLARTETEVVGNVVGVVKHARSGETAIPSLYVCDLKIAPAFRGRGLARRILVRGVWEILRDSTLRATRLLYGAAMTGAKGDVTRSARGWSPMRLVRPLARCAVYFARPEALRGLDPSGCPPPPGDEGLDLSPSAAFEPPGLFSTAGKKDLRLASTGQPWPLVHLPLGPRAWRPTWGHHLRACAERMEAQGLTGPACFSLDERLGDHRDWLAAQGVVAEAAFTVYGFSLPPAPRRPRWVHLATSEV